MARSRSHGDAIGGQAPALPPPTVRAVNEHWLCNGCKSLNVRNATRCYSCRALRQMATSAGEAPSSPISSAASATQPGSSAPSFATASGAAAAPSWGPVIAPGDAAEPLWSPESGPVPPAVAGLAAGYRSALLRARLAITFIALTVAGSIASNFVALDLLRIAGSSSARATAGGLVRMLQSPILPFFIAYFIVSIAAIVFFLAWLRRSVKNVPPLGGGWPSTSGLGVIGWWFVPIAHLFMPVRVVQDVSRRLAVPGSRGPGLIISWWLCWVAAQLAGPLLSIVTTVAAGARASAGDLANTEAVINTLSAGLYALAGFLCIAVIRDIQRSQDVRATAIVRGEEPAASRPSTARSLAAVGGAVALVVVSSLAGLALARSDDGPPAGATPVPDGWRAGVCGALGDVESMDKTLAALSESVDRKDLACMRLHVNNAQRTLSAAGQKLARAPRWQQGEAVRRHLAEVVAAGSRTFALYAQALRSGSASQANEGDRQLGVFYAKREGLDGAVLGLEMSAGSVCPG